MAKHDEKIGKNRYNLTLAQRNKGMVSLMKQVLELDERRYPNDLRKLLFEQMHIYAVQ